MLYVIIIFGILYQINLASSIFSASFSFDFLSIFFWFSCFFLLFFLSIVPFFYLFLLFSPLSAIRCHFLSNDFNRSPSIRLEWDSVTVLNYTLYFYDVCCNALLLLLFCTLSCFFAPDNRFDLNGCTSTQTVCFPGGVFLVFQTNFSTRSERFCSARNSSHYFTGCFPKISVGTGRSDLRWGLPAPTDSPHHSGRFYNPLHICRPDGLPCTKQPLFPRRKRSADQLCPRFPCTGNRRSSAEKWADHFLQPPAEAWDPGSLPGLRRSRKVFSRNDIIKDPARRAFLIYRKIQRSFL